MAPLLAQSASTQVKVEGEVLDDITGLPVVGTIVQLSDLGLAALSDDFGYFVFDSVPVGPHVVTTHHFAYGPLQAATEIVDGTIFVLRLTPKPIPVAPLDVHVQAQGQVDAGRSGRASDFISSADVREVGERTNQLLEVLRIKAPPRLQIRQQGGPGGISFCIQSHRRTPSVQELLDLGTGCRPVLIAVDGIIVYSPPVVGEMARVEPASFPEDVARLLLTQNPADIESIRVLTPSDGFFRYGENGRLGAVEIKTRNPRRPRGQ